MKPQFPARTPIKVEGPYEPGVKSSHMPYIGYHPLQISPQEEKFIHYMVSGMTPEAAGAAVGCTPATVTRFMNSRKIKEAINFFMEKSRADLHFNIAAVHKMYLDAYELARAKEDPMAMKVCAEALAKLHGIGADFDIKRAKLKKDAETEQAEKAKQISSRRQAERISDTALLTAAGVDPSYLDPKRPEPVAMPVIEGDVTDV